MRTRPVEDRAGVVLARVARRKGLVLARAVSRVSREEVEGARDARDTTARRAEEKRAARGDARDRSGRERGHGGVAPNVQPRCERKPRGVAEEAPQNIVRSKKKKSQPTPVTPRAHRHPLLPLYLYLSLREPCLTRTPGRPRPRSPRGASSPRRSPWEAPPARSSPPPGCRRAPAATGWRQSCSPSR